MINEENYSGIVANLVQNNLEKILNALKEKGTDKYHELEVRSETAFKDYLKAAVEKYMTIKTILYRTEPVRLYDFYVDMDLEYGEDVVEADEITDILDINDKVIITGTAGSGKSTLFKHLFLNVIDSQQSIPVFIKLRNLNNTELSAKELIYKTMSDLGFDLEKKYLELALSQGQVTLFFDGLDETSSEIRKKTTKELLTMKDRYNDCPFLVSSRPGDEFVSWENFTELEVQPLTKEKARELIEKIDYDPEIKEKFLEELESHLYENYQSFVSNPLLLTIMLMSFSQYADIPSKMHIFYGQAFETLYSKHDATKNGYQRNIYTNIAMDDFKEVLCAFSTLTYFDNKIGFDSNNLTMYLQKTKKITELDFDIKRYRKDLLESICMLVQDGLEYRFTHRTFQEYFTAIFISNSSEKVQKDLLQKLLAQGSKLSEDEVINLLFELDQYGLEKNFIIPTLERIRKQYNNFEKDSNYLKFLKDNFEEVWIPYNQEVYGYEAKVFLASGPSQEWTLVGILKRLYNDCFEKIPEPSPEEENKIDVELLKSNSRSELIEIKYVFGERTEEAIILNFKEISEEKELKEEIFKIFYNVTHYLDFTMYMLDHLKESHKDKSETIDDILL